MTGQRSFIVWIYDFGVNLPMFTWQVFSVARTSIRVPGNITCNVHVDIPPDMKEGNDCIGYARLYPDLCVSLIPMRRMVPVIVMLP